MDSKNQRVTGEGRLYRGDRGNTAWQRGNAGLKVGESFEAIKKWQVAK